MRAPANPRRVPQDAFVRARQNRWNELDALLVRGKRLDKLPPAEIATVASLYRSVCADLMRARAARYGADLVAYLDGLAATAHNALYRAPPYRLAAVWELVARGFPRTLREQWRFLASSTALFVVPLLIGFFGALGSEAFATGVVPKGMLEGTAEAYSDGFGQGRSEGEDSFMAGFYVRNNVGIAFRTFATGVFFGLGSAFFLVYNGLTIGAVLGWVTRSGAGRNIATFVCGHGAFELTAIVIAGAAGLQMGYALVRTRGRTRFGSLRAQGPMLAQLVVGAGLMLFIAAFIEGYWSPSALPDPVKWSVAGMLWLGVLAYFVFAGRTPKRSPQGGHGSR